MAPMIPDIVYDLALILICAGLVSLIFRRLHQPVVLGYILVGILVGPHLPFFPQVVDPENIKVWADIGVLFLLFALGLEFSLHRLARVGGPATLTAFFEVAVMMAIGISLGQWMGWSFMDSLFLGGIVSLSSTTIVYKAFEEAGVKGRGFVEFVFGILIVEDLLTIVLLVLLSTLAVTQSFTGEDLLSPVLQLFFFLVLWFLMGIYILPTLARRVRGLLNDETLLLLSLGLCFLTVILATKAGFSPELGAFLMGSLLAETFLVEKVEKIFRPVRDLFAAIFFVSVGIIIDPGLMLEHWTIIVLISFIILIGKPLSTALGAILSGRSWRSATESGLSVAQIGEFSFIIAALGLSLGVISDFLYPIAVGVSAVTIFTTPYMIRSSDRFNAWIERVAPARVLLGLDHYREATQRISANGPWSLLLIKVVLKLLFNGVIVAAIFLSIGNFIIPVLENLVKHANLVGLVFALTLSTPFIWAMIMSPIKGIAFEGKITGYAPITVLKVLRKLFTLLYVGFLSFQLINVWWGIFIVAVGALFIILAKRRIGAIYDNLVSQLSANYKEGFEGNTEKPKRSHWNHLVPWDAHLSDFIISPHSNFVGKSLGDLAIRERFGVMVTMVERGGRQVLAPPPDLILFPYDKVLVLGTDEEILIFRDWVEPQMSENLNESNKEYGLMVITVDSDSELLGKTIRESGVRKNYHGLVVGIERDGQRILNPSAAMRFLVGDKIWIVGQSENSARSMA